ncbi:MAG: hypothetical protein Q7T81_14710 [Pseudolabrys sp.]|nr:hypothetical protein [Pseudolabrys sp.]
MKVAFGILFSIAIVGSANAQTETLADRCAKKAGADKKAYTDCVSAAGQTKTSKDTQGRSVT